MISVAENWVEQVKESFGVIFDHLMLGGYYYLKIDQAHSIPQNVDNFPKYSQTVRKIIITSKDWRERMVNAATSYYLNLWVCYDLHSRQTIKGYSDKINNGGNKVEDNDWEEESITQRKIDRNLQSWKTKYVDIITEMKTRESNKGFPYYDLAHSLKKVRGELEEYGQWDSDLPEAYKRAWLTPVALQLIKWMAEDKFNFINHLFYRKTFLFGHNSTYSNKQLRECYQTYFCAIKELRHLDDPKEYVLSALMLQQYETLFEPMVAACLAICQEKSPWMDMDSLRCMTKPWWQCEIVKYGKRRERIYSKAAGDYETLMNFAGLRPWDIYEMHRLSFNHYVKKVILEDMLRTLLAINNNKMLDMLGEHTDYPSEHRTPFLSDTNARKIFMNTAYRPWTDNDFIAAKRFFETDYPIIESHISFQLGNPSEWPDSVLENIREYYVSYQEGEFESIRQSLADKRKKLDGGNSSSIEKHGSLVKRCPHCGKNVHVTKAGRLPSGKQKFKCKECNKVFTPKPLRKRYTCCQKNQAVKMLEENSAREVARVFDCSKSSVLKWKKELKHK